MIAGDDCGGYVSVHLNRLFLIVMVLATLIATTLFVAGAAAFEDMQARGVMDQ